MYAYVCMIAYMHVCGCRYLNEYLTAGACKRLQLSIEQLDRNVVSTWRQVHTNFDALYILQLIIWLKMQPFSRL